MSQSMDDYKRYLADEITYRALSRALKIHVNTAKACLYDFHKTQKSRAADSVHATYLIFGTPSHTLTSHQNGGGQDVDIFTAAPGAYPFSDSVPVDTMTLAAEDKLEATLRRYGSVHSIQVYSIGPGSLRDLRLLSDPVQGSLGICPTDDLEQLGTISNPAMTRTTGSRPVSVPKSPDSGITVSPSSAPTQAAAAKSTSFFKSENQKSKAAEQKPGAKEANVKIETIAETPSSSAGSSGPAKKPGPAAKRGSIMSAFAKTKPKATPAPLSDDGEDDSEPMSRLKVEKDKEKVKNEGGEGAGLGDAWKSRVQREAELRQMMEEDELDDEDEIKAESPEDEPMEEVPEEAMPEPELSQKETPPEKVVISDGRRRGKRRVTRKKQVMDDEGFLVTRNEIAWESFSESEEEPMSSKTKPPRTAVQPGKSKPGQKKNVKGAAAQGSITSFFAKKA